MWVGPGLSAYGWCILYVREVSGISGGENQISRIARFYVDLLNPDRMGMGIFFFEEVPE